MRVGDKLLVHIPSIDKFLEGEFKEYPKKLYFVEDKQNHIWVVIDNEDWLVPMSRVYKHFNN